VCVRGGRGVGSCRDHEKKTVHTAHSGEMDLTGAKAYVHSSLLVWWLLGRAFGQTGLPPFWDHTGPDPTTGSDF